MGFLCTAQYVVKMFLVEWVVEWFMKVFLVEWVVKVSLLQWVVKVVVLAKGFVSVGSAVTVDISSAHSGILVLGG